MSVIYPILAIFYFAGLHFLIRGFLFPKYDNYAQKKYHSFTSTEKSIGDDSIDSIYILISAFLYFIFGSFVLRVLRSVGISITNRIAQFIITVPIYHFVASLLLLLLLDWHNQKKNKDYFAKIGEKYLNDHQSDNEYKNDEINY